MKKVRTVVLCTLFGLSVGPLPAQGPPQEPVLPPAVQAPGGRKVMEINFNQLKIKVQPPSPPYPQLAKRARIQGTVVVETIVGPDGMPETARAILGPPELCPAAEAYAMQVQFEPARLNGVPQRARFKLTMPFRLGGGPKVGVQQTVLEVTTPDPALENLVPTLAAEAEAALKRQGVTVVTGTGDDPERTHHLRITFDKPDWDGGGFRLSLRCCLLKTVQDAAAIQTSPKAIRTWNRDSLPADDPVGGLKAELGEALLQMVEVPPAPESR